MVLEGFIQNEKLFVSHHLSVDHISECVPAHKKSCQMSCMLCEEVKNDCIKDAPGWSPYMGKGVCDCDKDNIGWDHHDATKHIDEREQKDQVHWLVFEMSHVLINFFSIEKLQQAE